MEFVLYPVLIFIGLIKWIIVIQVVLSWFGLFGIFIRIRFFESITEPIYSRVRKYVPTTFGMIDFTPLIVLFVLGLIDEGILQIFPSLSFFF